MADKQPYVSSDTSALPITAALPRVAEQHRDLTAATDRRAKRAVPTQLKVLIVAAFVIALGFGLIAPVLPRYAASYDVGAMAASAVVSIFALTRLLFAPGAGKIVVRLGERNTYIWGLLIVAAGSFGTAASWDYFSLMVFRAIGGLGSVMFTVSAMGLLVRHSPVNLRGRISGYYATAFLLGNILGPVLGAVMSGLGMRLPFVIYGGSLLVAAAVVWVFLKESAEGSNGSTAHREQLLFTEALRFSSFKSALVTNFAIGWAALGIRVSLMPLAAVALLASYHAGEDYDANAGGIVLAGVAMATYAACNAIMQNISGSLSDRHGRRVLIFTGLFIAGVSTIMVGLAANPVMFVVFSGITGFGTGCLAPSLQAAVADIIGSSRAGGTVLANFQMAADFGQIIGPIIAGLVADHLGFGPAFVLSACFFLVAMIGWIPGRTPKFPAELAEPGYTGK
ncbi:MFS transporter [Rothia sp. LK2588]|uniref:MFS transporter n=1 Tax=Rothia sp. LK2588 TaxID=3114369 RepID=UPI0034CE9657